MKIIYFQNSSFNFIQQQSNVISNVNKIEFEDSPMNMDEESDDSMVLMSN